MNLHHVYFISHQILTKVTIAAKFGASHPVVSAVSQNGDPLILSLQERVAFPVQQKTAYGHRKISISMILTISLHLTKRILVFCFKND